MHLGEKPFKCSLCTYSARTGAALKVHIRRHTVGKPYICKLCDFQSSSRNGISNHLRTHMKREKLQEKLKLGENFNGVSKRRHKRVNKTMSSEQLKTGVRCILKCHLCPTAFTHHKTLKRHIANHTYKLRLECPICFYACKKICAMKQHLLKHKDANTRILSCSLCNYTTELALKMAQHLQSHNCEQDGVKDASVLTCSLCFLSFERDEALNEHMQLLHSKIFEQILVVPSKDEGKFTSPEVSNLRTTMLKDYPFYREDGTNRNDHTKNMPELIEGKKITLSANVKKESGSIGNGTLKQLGNVRKFTCVGELKRETNACTADSGAPEIENLASGNEKNMDSAQSGIASRDEEVSHSNPTKNLMSEEPETSVIEAELVHLSRKKGNLFDQAHCLNDENNKLKLESNYENEMSSSSEAIVKREIPSPSPEEKRSFLNAMEAEKNYTSHQNSTSVSASSETAFSIPIIKQEYLFECSYCDFGADKLFQLNIHLLEHSEFNPYECSFCPETFSHPIDLKIHMNAHGEED